MLTRNSTIQCAGSCHSAADFRSALENLWDACERLKTLEPGTDKQDFASKLVGRADGASSAIDSSSAGTTQITCPIIGMTDERPTPERPHLRAAADDCRRGGLARIRRVCTRHRDRACDSTSGLGRQRPGAERRSLRARLSRGW